MAFLKPSPSTAGLLILGAVVCAGSVFFWAHDAMPYLLDYTEESYRRYWPHRFSLLPHILGGTVALFLGPFQIWSGLGRRSMPLHRWMGYAYVTSIAVAALSSFSLVFHTMPDFGLALAVLAAAWLATVAMAIVAIRNRRIEAHRQWMVRSYIVTFSFVSYRFLVDLTMFDGLGAGRFASVLWLSWVLPMMTFELLTQWKHVGRPRSRPTPTAS